MPPRPPRWVARLNDVLTGDYCVRHERLLQWLRTPLAALGLAMFVSFLCGVFLHPQGFTFAVGLATIVLVGVVWPWLSLIGLAGSLSFEKGRAREGEPVKVRISLRNRCPWGASGIAILAGFECRPDRGQRKRPDAGVSHAAGWRTTSASWDFVPACRGEYPAHPPLIASGFPFGLWAARRRIGIGGKLVVWPRTFPVGPIPDAADGFSTEGLARRDKPGTWGDLLGVRPYRRGDMLRRIHWPQTARHGQLVVCEVQSSAVPRVQIVLDADPAAHVGSGPDGSREWAIRVAASLAEGWIAQGANVELILDGALVLSGFGSTLARAAAVLDALAQLGPGGDHHLAGLLSLPQCRRGDLGLRVVVTTDLGLFEAAHDVWTRLGDRFVVLNASGFGQDEQDERKAPLPIVPWIRIEGPERVAPALRRAGKEVALVR